MHSYTCGICALESSSFLSNNPQYLVRATYILSMSSLSLSALGRSTLLPSTRTWARENKPVNRQATCLPTTQMTLFGSRNLTTREQYSIHFTSILDKQLLSRKNPCIIFQEANVHRTCTTNIRNLHTGLSAHEDQTC